MAKLSRCAFAVGIMACGLFAAAGASAQNFPNKLITIVVAQAPGDQADLMARVLAPEMSKALGQPVIVTNKPGAGTFIGTDYVATQAPADGYTIGAISANSLLTLALTVKEATKIDPLKELPPFIEILASRLVLAANAQQTWKSFPALVAYARANPGKLNYGSSSPPTRILTELLLRAEKLDIAYVPYSTAAANFSALSTGEHQLGFMPEILALNLGPALQILAQTGDKRSANLPAVPTFGELGYPQIPGSIYSFNLRSGTPKPIVDKLHAVVSAALRQPDVMKAMAQFQGEIVAPQSPEAAAVKEAEIGRNYAALAKQLGIEPQ